jgi:hypothetical protein
MLASVYNYTVAKVTMDCDRHDIFRRQTHAVQKTTTKYRIVMEESIVPGDDYRIPRRSATSVLLVLIKPCLLKEILTGTTTSRVP